MVCDLLYTGVPPLTVRRFAPPRCPSPDILGGAFGAHFLNPSCMDLGPDYRFEIRKCPSRLGNTWRWLVFKDRTLIATGVVLARDRSSAEAAAKATLEKSGTPELAAFSSG
jgi:hypothetical protein